MSEKRKRDLDELRRKVQELKERKKNRTENKPTGTRMTEEDLKKLSVVKLRRLVVDNKLFTGISRLRKAELIKRIMRTEWFKGKSKPKPKPKTETKKEEPDEDIELEKEDIGKIEEKQKEPLKQEEEKEEPKPKIEEIFRDAPFEESFTADKKFNPKYIFYYGSGGAGNIAIKFSQLNCFIWLVIKYENVSRLTDMSYLYMEIFNSRMYLSRPRCPKGLSYYYLCELIKYLIKGDDRYKLFMLETGNISGGRDDITHSIGRLRDYYRKLGFRKIPSSNRYMGQRISNFLNLCHKKFPDDIRQVPELRALCDKKTIVKRSKKIIKKLLYEQDKEEVRYARNLEEDVILFFFDYLDALKICSKKEMDKTWKKPLEDVMDTYDKNENETIPDSIFLMSNFEDGDELNKWLRLFGIDNIDELREQMIKETAPEWINHILYEVEGWSDIGDVYAYYDLTEPDDDY
jgi:hypothetical protein